MSSSPTALSLSERPGGIGRVKRKSQADAWWRGALIYQIYPRSFLDASGNGIGDLAGIASRLDYVADLGVDAIWLSPFFESPMKDFGYDVSDQRRVDPIFGSMGDFDRLLERAHALNLRVVIDQVLSHTSNEHRWFAESRASRLGPKADWYVWANPRADGTPPNNWLSVFGGSAWQWDSRREQYYLHNFLISQPDLNFHCDDVREQVMSDMKFWLERGVDGFRLDAINFCYHDAQLRDNPPKPLEERRGQGFRLDNPYAYQRHLYDITRPENLDFLRQLRAMTDRYGDIALLGEINAEKPLETTAAYTSDARLHMAYNFDLLAEQFCANELAYALSSFEEQAGASWPCRAIGNHDVERVLSRWGNGASDPALAKLLNAFALSLKGTICTYQGEELGLTDADLSRDQIRDPYGINFWPEFKGRDGCRTPLPWHANQSQAGFTQGDPWLPVPPDHRDRAVDRQLADEGSVLNAYRRFTRWRAEQPALRWGSMDVYHSSAHALAFVRTHDEQQILACFNFSHRAQSFEPPDCTTLQPLAGHGFGAAKHTTEKIFVEPKSAFFAELEFRPVAAEPAAPPHGR